MINGFYLQNKTARIFFWLREIFIEPDPRASIPKI